MKGKPSSAAFGTSMPVVGLQARYGETRILVSKVCPLGWLAPVGAARVVSPCSLALSMNLTFFFIVSFCLVLCSESLLG
jgi:hypothetical protein